MLDLPLIEISHAKSEDKSVFLKHFLAGALAGAISRTVTAPIDRLKTFRQVDKTSRSLLQLLSDMRKEGGIVGLWRGNFLNVIKNTPKQAIRFSVYNEVKVLLQSDADTPLTTNQRFIAGGVAGLLSQVLSYPLEMLKVRMSLRTTGRYTGLFDAILKIYKAEGFLSFYRGFVPSSLSITPYSAIELAGYETLKQYWKAQVGRELNALEQFISGSISCVIAQVAAYPMMLVTVKMQADESDIMKRDGMVRTLRNTVAKEGITGLYKGMYVNILKFIPTMGLAYATYEYISIFLKIKME